MDEFVYEKILLFKLMAMLFLAPALWAEENTLLDPVQIFIQYYGTSEMDRVAAVVTANFRDGKPESQWASFQGKLLKSMGYERLESEIKRILVKDNIGHVHVRAKVDTLIGHVEHDEFYRVVQENSMWKIDAFEIIDQSVEEKMKSF